MLAYPKYKNYYLLYNSTIKCSSTGKSISSLFTNLTTLPLNFSASSSNHSGTGLATPFSKFAFTTGLSFLISLIATTSPGFTK